MVKETDLISAIMFGFHYITFVGVLMFVPFLRGADSWAVQFKENGEIYPHDSAVIKELSPKASTHTSAKEESMHNEETMARREKRTTFTTTIDGKFTVHLTVSLKPAEQEVESQMNVKGGRLQSSAKRAQNPIIRNCEMEYCAEFGIELDSQINSTAKQEEAKISQTASSRQVKTATPAKTDSKFGFNRILPTTTLSNNRVLTPPINHLLNRTKVVTDTVTRYPTAIIRPSIKPIFARTQTGRHLTTAITRSPTHVARTSRIRTTSAAPNTQLSNDSREDYLFLERRNENGPNKSRSQQQENGGKSPKAATRIFQSTRIQTKKLISDVISTTDKNELMTGQKVQMKNVTQSDEKVTFFRKLAKVNLNSSIEEISDTRHPSPKQEVTTQMTISSTTLPVPLTHRIMSNATLLDEFNTDPLFVQKNVPQYDIIPESSIPIESTATEKTGLNQMETAVPIQVTTSDNPISSGDYQESEFFPWEQIGNFEFQINPKSKQVVNIRIQRTTTTPTSYNPGNEEKENFGLNQGERQQEILGVGSRVAAPTLEIPAMVIPSQTAISPVVKLPIPMNRREPITANVMPKPEIVDTLLESIPYTTRTTPVEAPATIIPSQTSIAPVVKLPIPMNRREPITAYVVDTLLESIPYKTRTTPVEAPATIIPSQTSIAPVVKLPIPMNRREPITANVMPKPEIVDTLLESIPYTTTPAEAVEWEKTVFTDTTQTTTIQNPELSGEYKQTASGTTEMANISVQLTPIPKYPPTTDINISTVTSGDIYREETPIAKIISTQSGPTVIQPPISINPKSNVEKSNVSDNISLGPVIELPAISITSVVSDIPVQTTSNSAIELSTEFPWEQRHDYEVQVDPKTKQVVNIRMLTSTTDVPLSVKVSNDYYYDKTDESVLRDEEQDQLPVGIVGKILNRGGNIRKLVVPRLRGNVRERILLKNSEKFNGNFPDVKVGTRFPVLDVAPSTVPHSRDRSTLDRKPTFHHSSEDGIFFRYANEEDEFNHYITNANNRNQKMMDDERGTYWNTHRDDLHQRRSPYFYYRNSSALVKSSGYLALLVAFISFLFL